MGSWLFTKHTFKKCQDKSRRMVLLCFWQKWNPLYAVSSLQVRTWLKVVSGALVTIGPDEAGMRLSCSRWSQIMGFKLQLNRLAELLSCAVKQMCSGIQLCLFFISGDNFVHFSILRLKDGRLDLDAPGKRVQPGSRNNRYLGSLTEHGERVKMPL